MASRSYWCKSWRTSPKAFRKNSLKCSSPSSSTSPKKLPTVSSRDERLATLSVPLIGNPLDIVHHILNQNTISFSFQIIRYYLQEAELHGQRAVKIDGLDEEWEGTRGLSPREYWSGPKCSGAMNRNLCCPEATGYSRSDILSTKYITNNMKTNGSGSIIVWGWFSTPF